MTTDFSWRREVNQADGLELIILRYQQDGDIKKDLQAWVATSHGSNLCRFSFNGNPIIDFDQSLLLKKDFTGTPVLYPTPNRVRNGVFRYQGKNFPQVKNGVRVYEHGLVHNEPWHYSDPQKKPDSINLTTWFDFEESHPAFQAFPFKHRLSLEFCLRQDGIQVSYHIENKDHQVIPFGFGLHPYFSKLSGDAGTFVELPAIYVMDYTSDLLPTGRLIEVQGTQFDLRKKVDLGSLDFDHVFTGVPADQYAQVDYGTLQLSVRLVTTRDFTHMVLYSPRGENYFCLENQTCSTDAHNLADRNFTRESGLKFVQPGENHTGSVSYLIEKEE